MAHGEAYKKDFVEKSLAPAMIAAGTGIKRVEYRTNERPFEDDRPPYATHYTEELVVWYDEWYYKTVNIAGDSPSGIFCDIVRQGIF